MVNLTIWISLALYALAVAVSFSGADPEKRQRSYRMLWRLGCMFALLHVLCAFHLVHGWNHQIAVKHTIMETERVTGYRFEYGIYFNYLFLLTWTIDCFGKTTNNWWKRFVHVYMLFIIISGTIVFEDGPIRYITFVVLAVLSILFYRGKRRHSQASSRPN